MSESVSVIESLGVFRRSSLKIQQILTSKGEWHDLGKREVTAAVVRHYARSVWDANPVHTDLIFARSLKLSGTIVPGIQGLGIVSGLLDELLRDVDGSGQSFSPARLVGLDARFFEPAVLGLYGVRLAVSVTCSQARAMQDGIYAQVGFNIKATSAEDVPPTNFAAGTMKVLFG